MNSERLRGWVARVGASAWAMAARRMGAWGAAGWLGFTMDSMDSMDDMDSMDGMDWGVVALGMGFCGWASVGAAVALVLA